MKKEDIIDTVKTVLRLGEITNIKEFLPRASKEELLVIVTHLVDRAIYEYPPNIKI